MKKEKKEPVSRYDLMINTPIPKLINKMAIPSIISMLVSSLYVMVDTMFVSMINTSAAAASGVVFPVVAIIQAIGLAFGIGSASYISRLMGEKKVKEAKEVVSTAFFSAIIVGALLMTFGIIFLNGIVDLLGSTETIRPYAYDYALYILIAAPFFAASMVLNATLRAEGSAMLSLVGILIGTVLNVVLDPILIFTFNMGIAGAAIATGISQLVSFLVLLSFYITKRSILRVNIKYFKFTLKMLRLVI